MLLSLLILSAADRQTVCRGHMLILAYALIDQKHAPFVVTSCIASAVHLPYHRRHSFCERNSLQRFPATGRIRTCHITD
jgi:hypothetical protein